MINPHKKAILSVLLKKRIYLNTTMIARLSKMSWNTASKYLEEMYEDGWIEKKGKTLIYWKAIIKTERERR